MSFGLQFVSPTLSGLVRLSTDSGLFVVALPDGRLVTFTGERVTPRGSGSAIGGLSVRTDADSTTVVFEGPALLFPDTNPFEDLERSFAVARLVEVAATLRCRPEDDGFGAVTGVVAVAAERWPVGGSGYRASAARPPAQVRVAVRLGDADFLAAVADRADGSGRGIFHRGGQRTDVVQIAARAAGFGSSRRLVLDLGLADGRRDSLEFEFLHQIPVVGNAAGPAGRSVHAVCRVPGSAIPAGWVELGGT